MGAYAPAVARQDQHSEADRMSAETDFRALLIGNAGVTALVSTRVAQNAAPTSAALPLVAFTAQHNETRGLDGTLLDDEVSFEVQCWANTAVAADAVADAIEAAITGNRAVTARASGYSDELALDCTVLTVQWWA